LKLTGIVYYCIITIQYYVVNKEVNY